MNVNSYYIRFDGFSGKWLVQQGDEVLKAYTKRGKAVQYAKKN